jgi:hypothetical protein
MLERAIHVQKGSGAFIMKAVATALVLIVGAAVVLWYGNMLNSWVVGGLVGGLAALLLSIPLSLVLFSYFARHRDESEQHRDDAFDDARFEEDAYFQSAGRRIRGARSTYDGRGVYQVVEEHTSQRATWNPYEDDRLAAMRQLPAPSTNRSHSARGYTTSPRLPSAPRNASPGRSTSHPTRLLPEYQVLKNNQKSVGTERSQLQAQALRAARLEASQPKPASDQEFESYEYDEVRRYENYYGSERGSAIYREQRFLEEERLLANEQQALSPRRRGRAPRRNRRIVDSTLLPEDGYEGYEEHAGASSTYEEDARSTDRQELPIRERHTDRIVSTPAPEKVGRSLVRRAPYLYEDDPMREEFAQHVREPITRRSSRYLTPPGDEEEQE